MSWAWTSALAVGLCLAGFFGASPLLTSTTPVALTSTSASLVAARPGQPMRIGAAVGFGKPVNATRLSTPLPEKFRQIKILTKSQATAVAVALRTGDAATVSGLIPEPYASSLNAGALSLAPLFETCGTDGLPGACVFGFETNPLTGQFGFQVLSVGGL
jgi:hypothetical protein